MERQALTLDNTFNFSRSGSLGQVGASQRSNPLSLSLNNVLRQTLTMILAGGQGERLSPLTRDRAKPAVPFGGIYRIIDFTLSNCLNSGLRKIHVLTQYKSRSLDRHIKQAWNLFPSEMDEYIDVLPPQQRNSAHWYQGTADAIFQNIYTIQMEQPRWVLVLGGDHIYKMDYSEMIAAHLNSAAALTIACTEVPRADAPRFGIVGVDSRWQIHRFREKPPEPDTLPENPEHSLVSMGIYIFNTEALVRELIDDARRESQHDFGKNIIPHMIERGEKVLAFPFRDRNSGATKYWRDIGTLDSYYDASMDLVSVSPVFNLYDAEWPIRTHQPQLPPAKTVFRGEERQGEVLDSLVSNGCIVSGGRVVHSILGPHVFVHSWAQVEDCVVFDDVDIGRRAKVQRAIIDKGVIIPDGEEIGYDLEKDRQRFTVTPNGVVVVPKGMRVESTGSNC